MGRITGPEVNTKAFRDRNRPMLKLTLDRLEGAVEAYDRILAISTEIRSREGREPMADGPRITAARAKLKASRKGKVARPSRKVSAKRLESLTPIMKVHALRKRREELEREREAINAEIGELVEVAKGDGDISVTFIADSLGLSRQRVYQLAG